MIYESILAVLFLYMVDYIVKRYYATAKNLNHLPGPKGLPLIGNTLQMLQKKPHVQFSDWAKEYGPVYKISISGNEVVIVTGTKELHELLVEKGPSFADRFLNFRSEIWSMNNRDLFLRNYDAKFKVMKKMLMKGLQQHNIKYYEGVTLTAIDDLFEDFKYNKGNPFDPSDSIFTAVYQMLHIMIFHTKAKRESTQFQKLQLYDKLVITRLSNSGPYILLDICPWLRYFNLQIYKDIVEIVDVGKDLFHGWKENVYNGNIKEGLFKELLDKLENNPDNLTEDNICMMILQLFGAGSSSTSEMVRLFLAILACNPEVQETLKKEVDEVRKEGRELSFRERDNMPYTFACVLETLRYSSFTPTVPHRSSQNTSLRGLDIPKGTRFLPNFWGQHHDPAVWQDPFGFNPNRFIKEDGSMVPAGEYPRNSMFPFGAGTRACIGEALALSRLFLILARIVEEFEVLPETTVEQQPSIHPLDFKAGSAITLGNFKVRMIARN